MKKKEIKLFVSAPRSGKTRKLVNEILTNPDTSGLGNLRRFFVVSMVGDVESIDSTAISTLRTVNQLNPYSSAVLLTSKVKTCDKLFKRKRLIKDNPELIKFICNLCKRKKDLYIDDILQFINENETKILSFDDLLKVYRYGYCPETFSKIYSQYCELSVISKAKIEAELNYGGKINIFQNYELIIDEAHGMFNFGDINPLIFIDSIKNGGINKAKIRKELYENYYKELKSFFKKYGSTDVCDLIMSLVKHRIEMLINLIDKSVKRDKDNMLSDDFFITRFNDFSFASDYIYQKANEEKDFMKKTGWFKVKGIIDSLLSFNEKYLITDISGTNTVFVRFYYVTNKNGKKQIINPLKEKLFKESNDTTLITSTPFYREYMNLWFNSEDYDIKPILQKFDGTFYIFYKLGKCGVGSSFNDKNLNKHQRLISVLSNEYDKSNDLYVLARSLKEKMLMEKYFYDFRNPTYDDYIGSVTSEGVQRNEKLSLMLGFAYTPIDSYRQSAYLFRNTMGLNIPVESVRINFIKMLSAQRTVQAMFRTADIRDIRGTLIANLGIDELALIRRFPLSKDKNIKFIKIPENLRVERYPEFINKYLE